VLETKSANPTTAIATITHVRPMNRWGVEFAETSKAERGESGEDRRRLLWLLMINIEMQSNHRCTSSTNLGNPNPGNGMQSNSRFRRRGQIHPRMNRERPGTPPKPWNVQSSILHRRSLRLSAAMMPLVPDLDPIICRDWPDLWCVPCRCWAAAKTHRFR
jgi:hypothetical protein